MKNYRFMKQVKKWLKNNTKKQLIEKVLIWIEMNAQQSLQEWIRYDELFQESLQHKREKENLEWFLKSAESAIRYYENMSVWGFIRNKFR